MQYLTMVVLNCCFRLGLDVDEVEPTPEPMATDDAPPAEVPSSSAMEEID
jgi:hypothetical protein